MIPTLADKSCPECGSQSHAKVFAAERTVMHSLQENLLSEADQKVRHDHAKFIEKHADDFRSGKKFLEKMQ